MYGGMAEEESNFIPAHLVEIPARNFSTLRFLDFGPNAGYAYTWVFKEHFFITGSASTSLGAGYSTLIGEQGKQTQ